MANTESNQPDAPSPEEKPGSSKRASSDKSTSAKSSKASSTGKPADKNQPKKRVSRRQRDEQNTKILYGALAAAAVIIALVLVGQAVNQYYLTPRKVLATVNGHEIKREDYWKYRSNVLVNQISQYQQYASFFQGEQQQQYLSMAQQASAQLDEVWGSKDTDPTTLESMIDDQLYLDGLDSLGLSISDADVQDFIDERFADPETPLFTPTTTPTLIPERAVWATETAIASAATATAEAQGSVTAGSPEAVASPEAGSGSPVAPIAVEDASPAASPDGGTGTPVAIESDGSPVAVEGSPSAVAGSPGAGTPDAASPAPTQTPNQDEVRQTATANFDTYSEQVFDLTHMNHDDYVRLVAEPALARELVTNHFAQQVGQSAEQVHARHILVGTEELADKLYADLQADPELFAQLAEENSIDTATAPNGGDLGWFTRGAMVEPFEQVAFELAPDAISEPVQTEFGWHIIQVLDHQDNRALTDDQIQQTIQVETDRWLADQREAASISSDIEPTPTPSTQQFVPPAGAPTVAPASPVADEPADVGTVPAASPISE
jgi:parvulin-like peptidyl-prolyl isomerase